ncbi:MAG: hypothetical protein ACI9XO_004477 [Paraglaciecola sp.]|jgi:hypothetical protein
MGHYGGLSAVRLGAYSALSDRSFKDSSVPLNNVLPFVLQLEAKSYNFVLKTQQIFNLDFS